MQPKKDFFKNYPDVKEFHFTSDGQAFFQKSEAEAHATSLNDKTVETVKREDVEKEIKADTEKVVKEPAAEKAKAEPAKTAENK